VYSIRTSSAFAVIASAAVCLVTPELASAQPGCAPLPPSSGVVVDVSTTQAGSLQSILDAALPGDTIQLADGVYSLAQTLVLRTPGITLRSKSGNREGVVIDGRYAVNDLLLIQRSDVTIADLTVMRSYWHLVHVVPSGSALTGTTLHNLRAVDGGEQFVKVNPAGGQYADNGVIRCSSLELTDTGRAYVRNNCYTGGIDLHQARGWQISANVVSGFWCASGLSEHAIHAWTGSRDTVVDRNTIVNSARGIGLGLGSSGTGRTYSDAPCSGATYVGHYGGAITNNIVVVNDARVFASGYGFDTGISLEQSCETNVLHNTVASTSAPRSSSIEWRFANTTAAIANNLVTHSLVPRDGARATLGGNVTGAPLSLFVDVAGADLHLLPAATMAIDKAAPLATPLPTDVDGEIRGSAADVGADEYTPAGEPAVDGEAPAVTITAPTGGATVSKTVLVTVSAQDNVGVTHVALYVDGVLTSESATAPFTTKWNSKPARRGAHTLQEKAYYAAGNTAVSQVVTVYR
jgi:hypothetical protein